MNPLTVVYGDLMEGGPSLKFDFHLCCIESDPELAVCRHHRQMIPHPIVLKRKGHIYALKKDFSFYVCPDCLFMWTQSLPDHVKPNSFEEMVSMTVVVVVLRHWEESKHLFEDFGEGFLWKEGEVGGSALKLGDGEITEGDVDRLKRLAERLGGEEGLVVGRLPGGLRQAVFRFTGEESDPEQRGN